MKLLVTDLDGTLLMSGGEVHDDDVRAVVALKAHGVPVSVATGRLYSGTRRYCRELSLGGPVGCADGSQLVDAGDDRLLALHPLPCSSLTWLLQVDAVPFVFADDNVHHDARGVEHVKYVKTWSEQVLAHTDLDHLRESPTVKVVVLIGAEGPVGEARDRAEVEGLTVLSFPFLDGLGLVVRGGGTDKGTAVEFIARQHGVALEDVAVVGDWLNDVPMLKRAGHAFVMGHAPDEVKAHAKHVLDTSRGGGRGLALIAKHFGVKL